jgi:hypothetical protein
VVRPRRPTQCLHTGLADVLEAKLDLAAFDSAPINLLLPTDLKVAIEDPWEEFMSVSSVLTLRVTRGVERRIGMQALDRLQQWIEDCPPERRRTDAIRESHARPWCVDVVGKRATDSSDCPVHVVPSLLVLLLTQSDAVMGTDEIDHFISTHCKGFSHRALKEACRNGARRDEVRLQAEHQCGHRPSLPHGGAMRRRSAVA